MNINDAAVNIVETSERFVGYCSMQCTKCGKVHPLNWFTTLSSHFTGYTPHCNECRRANQRKNYKSKK